MKKQSIVVALSVGILIGFACPVLAQAVDPYTTNLGVRYDFLSHSGDDNSALGFNADVTRMIGGFARGGGWGAGGGVDFEKFTGVTLKEFEAYVHAQGKATGRRELSPFGRFGLGFNSGNGATDMLMDFRGGVDFKLRPDAPYLISTMISIKRVFAGEFAGISLAYTVTRLSAGIVLPLNK